MQFAFRLYDHEIEAVEAVMARHGISVSIPELARDALLRIISTDEVPPPVRRERPPRRSGMRRASSLT